MRLILMGDVMLGRCVNRALRQESAEYPWGDVLPILRSADARILNLECVISDLGEPWPNKTFVFRSDLKNVDVLNLAHITAVSLANNHALDMGGEALGECLRTLNGRGIQTAGAGMDSSAARTPALFRMGSLTAAVVAFTDNEPGWAASASRPGVFFAPVDPDDARFQAVLDLVRHVSKQVDLTLVSAHWGPNWGEQPLPAHVEGARMLIESGADVVFGHSAHIVRGVGFHDGKPILYSCGDFIDDYAVDEMERNDESFLFVLDFEGKTFQRLLLVPTVIRDLQVRIARGWERQHIQRKMQRLSQELGTDFYEVGNGLVTSSAPEGVHPS